LEIILYHRIIYVYVFVFYSTDEQGERNRNGERENGEEIYAKDSMKLGVQVKSNSVLQQSLFKVTVYDKNGKFTILIFFRKNKRFLGIF